MRTPPLVPDLTWGKTDADIFRQEAGFGPAESGSQAMLCATCVGEGNYAIPSAIVLLNGTSLCPQHM